MASKKKRGLNRGLDKLLNSTPSSDIASVMEATPRKTTPADAIHQLPIEQLQRGKYQPRQDMHADSLEELAQSIKAYGILQPIVVRKLQKDNYEIIAGERRWRAAQLASLHKVPVLVKDFNDEEALAVALIENIQREDLNPIEEAIALERLNKEFMMTHDQIAQSVGKSRSAVSNLLRLLTLTDEVRRLVENGDLEMGHARALLALDKKEQIQTARTVVAKGLSVRETESLVAQLQKPAKADTHKRVDPDVRKLEKRLGEQLGVAVQIQHGSKGKGKLIILYHSIDELEGVLAHIQ